MGNKKEKKNCRNYVKEVNNSSQTGNDQIEYALKTMDRTDAWINSCDNKLSVLLGVCGVVLTVCITSESISKAYSFIKNIMLNMNDGWSYAFIVGCLVTVLFYVKAIYHIINALVARVDSDKFKQEQLRLQSNLFFGSISAKKYEDFKKNFLEDTSEEILNDILSQVYINSSIAQTKHKHYNKSLLWIGISVITTLFIVLFGIIAF